MISRRLLAMMIVLVMAFLVYAMARVRQTLDRPPPPDPLFAGGGVASPARAGDRGPALDTGSPAALAPALNPGTLAAQEPDEPSGYAAIMSSGVQVSPAAPGAPQASPGECRGALSHMRELLATTDSEKKALDDVSLDERVARICHSVKLPRRLTNCLASAKTVIELGACQHTPSIPREDGAPDLYALKKQADELGIDWPDLPTTRAAIDRELEDYRAQARRAMAERRGPELIDAASSD